MKLPTTGRIHFGPLFFGTLGGSASPTSETSAFIKSLQALLLAFKAKPRVSDGINLHILHGETTWNYSKQNMTPHQEQPSLHQCPSSSHRSTSGPLHRMAPLHSRSCGRRGRPHPHRTLHLRTAGQDCQILPTKNVHRSMQSRHAPHAQSGGFHSAKSSQLIGHRQCPLDSASTLKWP